MTDATAAVDPAVVAAQAAEAAKTTARAAAADAAVVAFVHAYAQASTTNNTTFSDPAIRAGLKAVLEPIWKTQSNLGMELSSWIGILQTAGYEDADPNARKRFNTALSTALDASFDVPRAVEDLFFGMTPPIAPAA